MMAVDVTPGDEFQAGRPSLLIDNWTHGASPIRGYDILEDGSFVTVVEDASLNRNEWLAATELHIILNFVEELKARVGN